MHISDFSRLFYFYVYVSQFISISEQQQRIRRSIILSEFNEKIYINIMIIIYWRNIINIISMTDFFFIKEK